jgi:glycosyltransferase involved in cell wall biosynthesis
MKKKLILFMPSFEGGGVEKNLFLIANFFIKKIDKISIITVSKRYKNKFDKRISFLAPKYFFWDNFGRLTKYVICLYLLFLEYLKDKNLIVFCFQGNILCIILCKLLNIKIIIRPNSSPSGWSKNFIKKKIFTSILKLSDRVIVNSIKFKNELKVKFKINSEYIYNPLNYEQIKKLSKTKINKQSFKKTLKIITVGRLVEQKNQITLLKAINHIKNKMNLELLIIGEGKDKEKLSQFIKDNKLDKIVKLKNYIKNPYPYILSSDIFVLSSLFEGLPNVLLEAIALKTFVISSNCPTGPAEILDNGRGGLLFKMKNYKDLANKILFFKSNTLICKKKIQHASKRLSRFDFDTNLKKYLKITYSLDG